MDFNVISKEREMNRLKMIRGNNDRVLFIETQGKAEKVIQVDVDSEQARGLNRRVVFDIYGAKTVSLATDCLNFEDDRNKKC